MEAFHVGDLVKSIENDHNCLYKILTITNNDVCIVSLVVDAGSEYLDKERHTFEVELEILYHAPLEDAIRLEKLKKEFRERKC